MYSHLALFVVTDQMSTNMTKAQLVSVVLIASGSQLLGSVLLAVLDFSI